MRNKENIEKVEETKEMLLDGKFEKDYEEYKRLTTQCIVEHD